MARDYYLNMQYSQATTTTAHTHTYKNTHKTSHPLVFMVLALCEFMCAVCLRAAIADFALHLNNLLFMSC